ncbi:hypothetical protein [Streptomyces sp. B1I3]|nr:hypothetical protein [Streptomyces sp. B1I3]MDQ0798234.1 hypothetical protein [Streptomyces sp. B1I3]
MPEAGDDSSTEGAEVSPVGSWSVPGSALDGANADGFQRTIEVGESA